MLLIWYLECLATRPSSRDQDCRSRWIVGDGAGRLCTFVNDIHACFLLTIKEVSQRSTEALPSIALPAQTQDPGRQNTAWVQGDDFLLATIRTLQPHDGNRSGVEPVDGD